jgi:hypothetical protein
MACFLRRLLRSVTLAVLTVALGVSRPRPVMRQTGLNAHRFARLALRRYRNGIGAGVRFRSREYLNFQDRHQQRSYPSPASTLLFFADVLRLQGFLDTARAIYLASSNRPRLRYTALCSLGDTLLVEAYWAREAKAYDIAHLAIDPWAFMKDRRHSWRDSTFEEAIAVLRTACAIDRADERAPWLLTMAYLAIGDQTNALPTFQLLESILGKVTSDLDHLRVRVMFSSDSGRALALGNQQLAGWYDDEGFAWCFKDVQLCRGDELRARASRRTLEDQ